MNKRLQDILKYTVFLLVGGLFLYLAFQNTDLEKLARDFAQANYSYVLLSMLMGYLAFVSRGLRWNLLLEPMGTTPKKWNSIHAIAIGYLANAAVPRAGELARCTSLHSTDEIPVNRLFGTVMLERMIDGLILMGLMLLTVILELDKLLSFFDEAFGRQRPDQASIIWKVALGLVFLALLVLVYLFRARFQHLPFYSKVRDFWQGFKEGFKSFAQVKRKGIFFAHTLFIWSMYYLMIYIVVFALPATDHIDPTSGLFLMILGGMGMVVPSPGGIGSYHYLVMLGMGVLGVSASDGVSFATLVHGGQFIMTILAGLIALALVYRERRRLKKAAPAK